MPAPSNNIPVKNNIPTGILNRINALRNLQLQTVKMESELFNTIFHLEQDFTDKLKPLLAKREQIINGKYEPNQTEFACEIPLPEEYVTSIEQSGENASWMTGCGDSADLIKGIPNFWLQVLKNAEPVSSLIQEYDEPALQSLNNITLEYGDATEKDDIKSFTLIFHFSNNKYFKNEQLTKKYQVRVSPSTEDPFVFEGPEIVACTGCDIDWHSNMNVTQRTIRRRKINKSDGKVSFVSKSIPRDSFFHFFIPPNFPGIGEETTEELDELLEEHYEVGHFMREKLIPNAILFYTGESPDVDSEFGDDDDDDDEEEDDENDQESSGSSVDNGIQGNDSDGESSEFSDNESSNRTSRRTASSAARGTQMRHLPG